MQHGPMKKVVVARQGQLTYLNNDEYIFEHGCHDDAKWLQLGAKFDERKQLLDQESKRLMKSSDAGEKAAGKRRKDVLGNAFFSRVVEKVQTDEDHENHEELENFCPTGFVFNEDSQNLIAIASKNGQVVAKQAAAEGPR